MFQVKSVAHLQSTLEMVHGTVVSYMGCTQKHQNNYYDCRAHEVRYSKGDHVLLLNKKPNLLTNQFHDRWLSLKKWSLAGLIWFLTFGTKRLKQSNACILTYYTKPQTIRARI